MDSSHTDWTMYYSKKKSFFSEFTQRFTLNEIANAITTYAKTNNTKICELGGGNSCFIEGICAKYNNISTYDVVDNNHLAIELFDRKNILIPHRGVLQDLTTDLTASGEYDFVFSVGLIEHFDNNEQIAIINKHFDYCTEGGTVLITFPTPTLKYRFFRKLMEVFHVWQFWDESPLWIDKIRNDLEKQGEIMNVKINNKLFLTQTIVVIKKHNCGI